MLQTQHELKVEASLSKMATLYRSQFQFLRFFQSIKLICMHVRDTEIHFHKINRTQFLYCLHSFERFTTAMMMWFSRWMFELLMLSVGYIWCQPSFAIFYSSKCYEIAPQIFSNDNFRNWSNECMAQNNIHLAKVLKNLLELRTTKNFDVISDFISWMKSISRLNLNRCEIWTLYSFDRLQGWLSLIFLSLLPRALEL